MMVEMICPGLQASWVNAWLAAIGTTQLVPNIRLRWTPHNPPQAVLCSDCEHPVELLTSAWPTQAMLQELAIAETWRGMPPIGRKVFVDEFAERARAARSALSSWTLSSTVTDLHVTGTGEVAHAPFDPAGPGTIKWLHHRLVKVHGRVNPTEERLASSLLSTAARVKDNGLGFDITRLASQADTTDKYVDPVIEVLAFFGLALLPVRGDGTDARINKSVRLSTRQRGWEWRKDDKASRCFVWPAWEHPLDFQGVDALMDIWKWWDKSAWRSIGVHRGWRTVRYQKRGKGDTTRAFGSEPL